MFLSTGNTSSKYPPAEPGALGLEPLETAYGADSRRGRRGRSVLQERRPYMTPSRREADRNAALRQAPDLMLTNPLCCHEPIPLLPTQRSCDAAGARC
jgi:hypothetical protein